MPEHQIDTSGVRSDRLRRAISRLPGEAIRSLRERGDIVVKTEPYYSRLRIPMTVTGTAPYAYALAKGEFSAFDYAQGDSMANAGFPAAAPYDRATKADTNLISRSETVNNEWVFIDGIALVFLPTTDVEVAKRVIPDAYCRFDMNGTLDLIKLGNPLLLGGGPGLFGAGESRVVTPNAFETRAQIPGFLSNGMPDPGGVKKLNDVLLWGPKSSSDSNLKFVWEQTRAVSFTATARAADAAVGIPAWTPAAATGDVGTYLEVMVMLDCVQLTSRGSNR